jgi:hypothetical protein
MINRWIANPIKQFPNCLFNSEILCFDFNRVTSWICININVEMGRRPNKVRKNNPIVPTCWRQQDNIDSQKE